MSTSRDTNESSFRVRRGGPTGPKIGLEGQNHDFVTSNAFFFLRIELSVLKNIEKLPNIVSLAHLEAEIVIFPDLGVGGQKGSQKGGFGGRKILVVFD